MSIVSSPVPVLAPLAGAPAPARLQNPAADGAASDVKAIGKMLTGLIHAESALYAITREWRYDAAGRKFVRLHLLLDEQFAEIGIRLSRLAARSRDLGAWHCTGDGDIVPSPKAAASGGALQGYMLRELLRLHEQMVVRLKRAESVSGGRFPDVASARLFSALAADHEKDAFMLRALLWESSNTRA